MQIDSSCEVTLSSISKSITMLDAMHMLKVAWQDVKQSSIVNCFGKVGFILSGDEYNDQMELPPPDRISTEDFDAFVDIDSSLECHGVLTDDEICASVVCQDTDPQPGGEGGETEEPSPVPTGGEVIQALCTLRAYMEQHRETDFSAFYTMGNQIQKLFTTWRSKLASKTFLPHP